MEGGTVDRKKESRDVSGSDSHPLFNDNESELLDTNESLKWEMNQNQMLWMKRKVVQCVRQEMKASTERERAARFSENDSGSDLVIVNGSLDDVEKAAKSLEGS